MAKPKELIQFSVEIPDQPGVLAEFLKAMNQSKINLKGLWCFGTGGGKGLIFCVPQNAEKFRKVCEKLGYRFVEGIAFFFSGQDRPGALCKMLDKVADFGVNLHAVDAISVGGKFGAYLWVNPEDVGKLRRLP